MADDLNGRRPQHVVLPVRKGLRRCHDNRLSGMDSQRIKIFHVTNHNAIVISLEITESSDEKLLDVILDEEECTTSQCGNLGNFPIPFRYCVKSITAYSEGPRPNMAVLTIF